MNPVFNINVYHFVLLSLGLVGAGVATILTKRNAIGILIGVELVLNAAGINFVAFNKYLHHSEVVAVAAEVELPQSAAIVPAGSFELTEASPSYPETMDKIGGASAQFVRRPALHGQVFTIFIIVLAAAEAAIALAIFLNFYNNFSSIDVERADELRG